MHGKYELWAQNIAEKPENTSPLGNLGIDRRINIKMGL
jgi:hypothetical protein